VSRHSDQSTRAHVDFRTNGSPERDLDPPNVPSAGKVKLDSTSAPPRKG
jgi:hypothetical protein